MCRIYQSGFSREIFYVIDYQNLKFPLREIILTSTLYGNRKIFLSMQYCCPGSILNVSMSYMSRLFAASKIFLENVPNGGIVCQIFNFSCNRVIFIRSSGTKAVKNRELRKRKLISLDMPSGISKLFSLYTVCFYSAITNLFLNKSVYGKWGISDKYKKKIVVRGVAMNCVDHPNGGRTKTNQPELSP
jgi:ribosomal protein L2